MDDLTNKPTNKPREVDYNSKQLCDCFGGKDKENQQQPRKRRKKGKRNRERDRKARAAAAAVAAATKKSAPSPTTGTGTGKNNHPPPSPKINSPVAKKARTGSSPLAIATTTSRSACAGRPSDLLRDAINVSRGEKMTSVAVNPNAKAIVPMKPTAQTVVPASKLTTTTTKQKPMPEHPEVKAILKEHRDRLSRLRNNKTDGKSQALLWKSRQVFFRCPASSIKDRPSEEATTTIITKPAPLSTLKEYCDGNDRHYLLLLHAVHAGKGGLPLPIQDPTQDRGLPEAVNNAVGFADFVTTADFIKAASAEGKGEPPLKPEMVAQVLSGKTPKFQVRNRGDSHNNRRRRHRKKNHAKTSELLSVPESLCTFQDLFQQSTGSYIVTVHMQSPGWVLGVAKHSFALNAAAGYLVDGYHGVVKIDSLRSLTKPQLDDKLFKEYGWLEVTHVYQVFVKKSDLGAVPHQIMPADGTETEAIQTTTA